MKQNNAPDNSTPEKAREYIKSFAPLYFGKEATYVTTNENRLIHFRNMSNDDASWVAEQLYSMVLEAKGKEQNPPQG